MNDQNNLLNTLRAAGHRLTPQRLMVIEALNHSEHHLSAEEIFQAIAERYPAIAVDPATIYRTLKWLRESRLVSEIDLGENHLVYALFSHHDHHHLVCEGCRAMLEIDPAIFEHVRHEIAERYGFEAHLHHIAIFGRCAHCRTEEA